MRKIIASMIMAILAIGTGWAQLPSSFPPKSYPASIMVVTDPGVKQYWDVKRIMYLGTGKGGHKFRVFGTGMKDMPATNIEMFYIRHDDQLQSAGAYFFPAIKPGEAFNFDIVSAFPGYAPSSFLGFMIKDDRFSGQEQARTEVPKEGVKSVRNQAPTASEVHENIRKSNPDEIRASEVMERYASKAETGYQPATFPGGKQAMLNWFSSKFKYLNDRARKQLPCQANIRLTIDKDGSVKWPVVDCGDKKELAREIKYYVERMPNWIPAKSNGEPISSKVDFPLNVK